MGCSQGSAGTYNTVVNQGATFRRVIRILQTDEDGNKTPINLTGYTARMQIRLRPTATDVISSLSSVASAGLIIDVAEGTITIVIEDEETATFDFKRASYDLEIESSGGEVKRVLQGTLTLSLETTR